jgi:hypothetical protein
METSMIRSLLLPLALLGAPPAPAFAASRYDAEPVAAPARPVIVTRDNVWHCGDAGCASESASGRPAVACAHLAQAVGALRVFAAAGRAFTAAELEACNRRARGGADTAPAGAAGNR